ncbi:MAG: type II 3-dehydroquinate dehydratase [Bacillota bacterium]
MAHILVINGVNLNMLGIREKALYGDQNLPALEAYVRAEADKLGHNVELYQSNYEGDIVTKIQQAYGKMDGIIINAGAYTHTSVAILDALKAVSIPTVEVHLTDIKSREEFRNFSYISLYAEVMYAGYGFGGYKMALEYFSNKK